MIMMRERRNGMPEDAMTLLAVVLGFAHDAVENDAAWNAVFDDIKAKQPDALEVQGEDASKKLRASVHEAVDNAMAAMVKAAQQIAQLDRLGVKGPGMLGAQRPSLPAPAASDPELDALIARQYL